MGPSEALWPFPASVLHATKTTLAAPFPVARAPRPQTARAGLSPSSCADPDCRCPGPGGCRPRKGGDQGLEGVKGSHCPAARILGDPGPHKGRNEPDALAETPRRPLGVPSPPSVCVTILTPGESVGPTVCKSRSFPGGCCVLPSDSRLARLIDPLPHTSGEQGPASEGRREEKPLFWGSSYINVAPK